MTKDEVLRIALSTLDEVRQEAFRLSRNGQRLYAEDKVWSTIITIKEALAHSAEREACAKVCEEQMQGKSILVEGARACKAAIQARGQE
jgi:hypothetical protein